MVDADGTDGTAAMRFLCDDLFVCDCVDCDVDADIDSGGKKSSVEFSVTALSLAPASSLFSSQLWEEATSSCDRTATKEVTNSSRTRLISKSLLPALFRHTGHWLIANKLLRMHSEQTTQDSKIVSVAIEQGLRPFKCGSTIVRAGTKKKGSAKKILTYWTSQFPLKLSHLPHGPV